MGVSYIPGPPQYGQGGGGTDPQGIVQLAMAVKSFKMQEAQQKKKDAQDKVGLLMANPQLLLMTDPKDLEKDFKNAYGMKFTSKPPADPRQATQVPTNSSTPPTGDKPTGGTANLQALAGATGGPTGGAQSANQPKSKDAPAGGGVTPGSPMNVEQMAAQAHQAQTSRIDTMAPLYMGAVDQLTMEGMKTQTITEIEGLKQRAAKGDFQAIGRLMMLSGKQVTDADMRAMLATSNMDPKIVNQALDFALGNETDGDKAKRFDSTLKTVMGNPEFMGRLMNPGDAANYVRSVVYGGTLPEGIQMKPHSITELNAEAAYEKQLTDQGIEADFAHTISRMRTDGISYTMGLPAGFHSILDRETGAKEKQASAAQLSAEAQMVAARKAGLKIDAELMSKKYDILNDRLKSMIEARKAKHPFPQEVENGLVNEVAHEVGLQPEDVSGWYQWVTGGQKFSYTPIPDDKAAIEGAGGKPKGKPQAKGGPSVGDYLGEIGRTMFNIKPKEKKGDTAF